jgi:S-adenosylmethionine/arginine decarboxylase-like enzyme
MRHLLITGVLQGPPVREVEVKKYLLDLVEILNMKVLTPPVAKYCDDEFNEGVSGFIMITTSHISMHFWDNGLLQMDVFSCKNFHEYDVIDYMKKHLDLSIVYQKTIFR